MPRPTTRPLTRSTPPDLDASRPDDRLCGTIVRIVANRGFCFIKTADKQEYFCHMSALPNGVFTILEEGTRVSFEEEPSPKGPRATKVTLI